jgi:tRNA 2-thiouridine synthesizing protein A
VNVIKHNEVLDARGLLCPMPVVRAGKAIEPLEEGQVLKILATDKASVLDVPAWAHDTGNELVTTSEESGAHVFYVRKGTGA